MEKRKFLLSAYLVFVLLLISMTDASDSSSSPSSSSSTSTSGGGGGGSSHKSSSSSTATQARQSPLSTAASIRSTLGMLVPSLITNLAPLVLLGVGAMMMMPSLGMGAMSLLRESRRSSQDQPLANMQLPGGPFAQYSARPIQSSPQDIYYFSKRSLPSLMSSFNSEPLKSGLSDLLVRVVRALENAEKRYN